jgi:hypothetical protein
MSAAFLPAPVDVTTAATQLLCAHTRARARHETHVHAALPHATRSPIIQTVGSNDARAVEVEAANRVARVILTAVVGVTRQTYVINT